MIKNDLLSVLCFRHQRSVDGVWRPVQTEAWCLQISPSVSLSNNLLACLRKRWQHLQQSMPGLVQVNQEMAIVSQMLMGGRTDEKVTRTQKCVPIPILNPISSCLNSQLSQRPYHFRNLRLRNNHSDVMESHPSTGFALGDQVRKLQYCYWMKSISGNPWINYLINN